MTKDVTKHVSEDEPHGGGLLARLDAADRLPGARELRELSYDLLGPARSVVDVGCGGGRAVAELTRRGVAAVGVDPDEGMLAAARARWPYGDFRAGDAYALPLEDRSVDGYRADKVFHELAAPEHALAEARRVLVPGGRIVLLGQDWDTVVVDSDDPALTRALVRARADLVTAPHAARRHRTLLKDAGFRQVTAEVRTPVLTGPDALPLLTALAGAATRSGAVDAERAAGWIAEQRVRAGQDRLFVAVPVFVAAGEA
jgi:SAM-dependent methyltransferase